MVEHLSLLVMRGDRFGFIGANDAGKSTLLKLILGELQPDSGSVRLGTNLQVAYFDQLRAQLDPERSLAQTVSPGSDWVEVGGARKHVISYLGDFLFAPQRVESPVRMLSRGERNRLLLATLFARPANVIVLDEPTNDLDIESLELLEATLQDFPGTVLLVSHDRRFLDNVVTQTLAAEGGGRWKEYVGGYTDWLEQRPARAPEAVLALVDLAIKYPEIDAFAALQSRRDGVPLFYAAGFNPSVRSLKGLELIPVDQAHFGLTLLRLSCFAKLEKPWFIGQPDPDGGWRTGRVDDDITFWQRWKAVGCSLALALRSVVGDSENMIIWPDKNMRPIFQFPGAFWESNCRPPSQTWGVGEVMPPILPAERPVNEALQSELQSALTEERSR